MGFSLDNTTFYEILLLPICGAYFLLKRTHRHRFCIQRLSSQELIFETVLVSILLLGIASLIIFIFSVYTSPIARYQTFIEKHFANISDDLPKLSGKNIKYNCAILLSFFCSFIYTGIRNLWTRIFTNGHDRCILKAINKHGDVLEQIFAKYVGTKHLIQITLKSNKVYIGFSSRIPVPKKNNFFGIIPLKSGYRDPVTHKIRHTNIYEEFIEKFENKRYDVIPEVLIEKEDILSTCLYDPYVDTFFQIEHKREELLKQRDKQDQTTQKKQIAKIKEQIEELEEQMRELEEQMKESKEQIIV